MQRQRRTSFNSSKKPKQLTSAQLANFFEQLSVFSGNGIATWESLSIMKDHPSNAKDQEILSNIFISVAGGKFLSTAMENCGGFPDYALGMIEVGEQTGRTQEVSAALAEYYKNKDKLAQNIRSSLLYPLGMSAMVLTVIFVLLVQVMPVFEQVFNQLGLALNPVSQFLLNTGQNLNENTIIILVILVAVIAFFLILRATSAGKNLIGKIYATFPLTKRLFAAEMGNRFSFAMSLMISSGLDTFNSLEFSLLISENKKARDYITTIIKNFQSGSSLTDAIVKSNIFKAEYNGMLVAGMRSGTSQDMFSSIADRCYNEAQKYTQKLLSILEPALVAVLCVTVGMVMLSVMLPLTGILTGM